MKHLRFLEWLWIAHAVGGLAAVLCLLVTSSPIFLVVVECLSTPLGWLLARWEMYSLLPQPLQYLLGYVALVLNGGVFYFILRVFARRRTALYPRS